jgi:phosphonate transport system permease protein
MSNTTMQPTAHDSWSLHQAITARTVGILLLVVILLGLSARNTELDRAVVETGQAVASLAGFGDSQVVDGAANFLDKAFPFHLSVRTETNRIANFDRENLPWLSHVEVIEEQEYDTLTDSFTTITSEYLIEPYGYLWKVLGKMWETIEMAFWGTVLAVLMALPLGVLGAGNYTPNKLVYGLARGICSFNRAMPELILALFLVLMYGFGPIAGILALALHTSGFLGKFFADDIENAPPGPQTALRSTGAGRLKVLRFAVLPQVMPQYYAYVQYILERNIRTATVLGIVGAGGIGTELKGRWEMFDYAHVSTILLTIFLTVGLLELLTQRLRAKAI